MHTLGHLPNPDKAQTFVDYLLTLGIPSWVRRVTEGYAICVFEEAHVERASREFKTFLTNPEAPRYRAASWQANQARIDVLSPAEFQDAVRQISEKERTGFFAHFWTRAGFVTKALTLLSVLVTLLTQFGNDDFWVGHLMFSEYTTGMPDVWQGQLYRLITPIFMHFRIIHLLFNMMWLWDLGGMIEKRRSSSHLLGIVVIIAVLSNIAQYLMSGPLFGGMSGVVYGLLGYIWIKSRREPRLGLFLPTPIVYMMLAWLAICFTGIVGPIANSAHLAGLVVGMLLAFKSTKEQASMSMTRV